MPMMAGSKAMNAKCVLVLSLLAASLLAGRAAAQDAPAYAMSKHPSQDGRCRGDTGAADLDRSEKACLAQLTGIATRQGNALRVKLQNGKSRVYQNRTEGCEQGTSADCIDYELTGYFAKHSLLLIQIGYYEGVEWMLVRLDNGKETKIVLPPFYSPHEKWLASACWSLGPSGCENGIDIVAAIPDQTAHEWHYRVPDDEDAFYEFVGWDGDERVKLNVTFNVGATGDQKTLPASVDLLNGVWQLKLPEDYPGASRR
jgi:hypothetical protein